jgi:hypothetical protein
LRRLHLEHVAEPLATASSDGASKAIAMRFSVPNWLISSGRSEPLTFSKSSAGPPP